MAADMVQYVKSFIEEAGLNKEKGDFDSDGFSEKLGMDVNIVMQALLILFIRENKKNLQLRDEVSSLARENKRLNDLVEDYFNGNGRIKQMALVSKGLPIAKKQNKNLIGLETRLRMGQSDKAIMEALKISRTTLWRWKKELEEEQRRLDELLKQGAKRYRR